MQPELVVRTTAGNGVVELAATGELEMATRDVLTSAIDDADDGRTVIALNLSGITFMDSSGIGALLVAHRHLDERLRVTATSTAVHRVLEICGLDGLFG